MSAVIMDDTTDNAEADEAPVVSRVYKGERHYRAPPGWLGRVDDDEPNSYPPKYIYAMHGDAVPLTPSLCGPVGYYCGICDIIGDAPHLRNHTREANIRRYEQSKKSLAALSRKYWVMRPMPDNGDDRDENRVELALEIEHEKREKREWDEYQRKMGSLPEWPEPGK